MKMLSLAGKEYQVDAAGFLLDFEQWDENFAQALAAEMEMPALTPRHWEVIRYIRSAFEETGRCPSVFETCRVQKLSLKDLKELFPTGYLRGACKLAGITYRDSCIKYSWAEAAARDRRPKAAEKVYHVDVRGFLMDPKEWDEKFAVHRAVMMKIPGGLTPAHWRIISYLRETFEKTGVVPTVIETCEANHLELSELERLFPDGYHRGAVLLAGLRVV